MTENHIVRQLHGIAEKLTADPDLQKDLMQEMFVHLVRIQTAEAGQALSWYLKSCEFHARNYLKPGRRIDSLKRSGNGVPDEEAPAVDNGEPRGNGAAYSPAAVAVEIQGERITNDIVNRIVPRLSDMQQQILFLLMKGCGVRETGREVGITHPAVIKHRKKIARLARELLQESAVVDLARPNGIGGSGKGEAQSN
jgi:DNA-directed RNA polymerase specialized sigma24 family protein